MVLLAGWLGNARDGLACVCLCACVRVLPWCLCLCQCLSWEGPPGRSEEEGQDWARGRLASGGDMPARLSVCDAMPCRLSQTAAAAEMAG